LANATAAPVTVTITRPGGVLPERAGSLTLSGNGHASVFLSHIPGFENLGEYQGILRVTSTAPVAMLALRGRQNERGDFVISTMMPFEKTELLSAVPRYFPFFGDSGGYTTQFVFFNGQAGTPSGSLTFFSVR
jgi:hypothetical protein